MTSIILPNARVDTRTYPVIYLAGPITGAPPWQDEAMRYLIGRDRDLFVVSPRRQLAPDLSKEVVEAPLDGFPNQRIWERHYMAHAAKYGAIMFWLPGEQEHTCTRPYASMTRFELGQWLEKYRCNPDIHMCIGTDGKFSEWDTIIQDFSRDAPQLRIFETLKATCKEALDILHKGDI